MDNINTPFNNSDELDLLRLQMVELRERIDRTTTLNETLLYDSIKRKMRGVHKDIYKVIILGLITCPAWLFIGSYWNLPWYFTLFTIVMLLTSMAADFFINRINVDTMADNMTETAHRLMVMKKRRNKQIYIAFPVLVAWMGWFAWELFHCGIDSRLAMTMSIGCAVGAIIGGAVGLRIFVKMQHANDDMLRQIKDLQG